jgi:hypothetical protein
VAFACGGDEPGLREATLRELTAPAVAPSPGFRDACLEVEIRLSLGFGYVMSQLGTHRDDPRQVALRQAEYRSIGVTDPSRS